MPGIVMGNRVLPIASDEVVFPTLFLIIIDFIFLIYALFLHLSYFQIFSITLFGFGLINDFIMCRISLTGGLKDLDARKNIVYPIYSIWFNLALHLSNLVYGFVLLVKTNYTPTQRVFLYLYVIYVILFIFFTTLIMLGSARFRIDPEEQRTHYRRYIHPLFMGSIFLHRDTTHETKPREILESVAALLLKLFGDANLVLSDILVGMILVGRGQSAEEFKSIYPILDERSELFDLKRIVEVSRYAEAMYGLPLRVFAKFKSGMYHLCCACVRRQPLTAAKTIEKSMDRGFSYLLCCFPGSWYRKLSHPDLIYTSIEGKLFKSPFAVCVDHDLKAVIIAIRGTMSTTDFLVDLYLVEKEMRWMEKGEEVKGVCHGGIFEIATAILTELEENGIISRIQNDELMKNYQVIVTGHSLGAGVAALLTFQLKSLPEFQEIGKRTIAYCYSSPGFLISFNAIPYFRTFCTTVVLGDDLVSRISPHNTHILKTLIVDKIQISSERKVDIIRSHFIEQIFSRRDLVSQSERPNTVDIELSEYEGERLYIPGNVLHLKRHYETSNNGESQSSGLMTWKIVPHWIDGSIFSKQILISRTMILDHLPNRVGNSLRSII